MDKNKVMMIVIIALLVVLLATIVGVSFFAFKLLSTKQDPAVKNNQDVEVALTPDQITSVPLTSPISTNLAEGSDGTPHAIRLSIELGVNNTDKKNSEKFITLLSSKEAVIRDTALSVIKSKTADELNRPDGPNSLRYEILTKLQDTFQDNLLVDLYISDWYVQ